MSHSLSSIDSIEMSECIEPFLILQFIAHRSRSQPIFSFRISADRLCHASTQEPTSLPENSARNCIRVNRFQRFVCVTFVFSAVVARFSISAFKLNQFNNVSERLRITLKQCKVYWNGAAIQSTHSASSVCFSREYSAWYFRVRLSSSKWSISAVELEEKLMHSWWRRRLNYGCRACTMHIVAVHRRSSLWTVIIISNYWIMMNKIISRWSCARARYIVFLMVDKQRETDTWTWTVFVVAARTTEYNFRINCQ